MSKFLYYSTASRATVLEMQSRHADGRLDLVDPETGELKVGRCPVSEEPKVGHCTPAPEGALNGPAIPEKVLAYVEKLQAGEESVEAEDLVKNLKAVELHQLAELLEIEDVPDGDKATIAEFILGSVGD